MKIKVIKKGTTSAKPTSRCPWSIESLPENLK